MDPNESVQGKQKTKNCLQIVQLDAITGNTRASVIAADDVEVRSCSRPFLRVTQKTDDSCLQALVRPNEGRRAHRRTVTAALANVTPLALDIRCGSSKTGPAEPLSDETNAGGTPEPLLPQERPQPKPVVSGTA